MPWASLDKLERLGRCRSDADKLRVAYYEAAPDPTYHPRAVPDQLLGYQRECFERDTLINEYDLKALESRNPNPFNNTPQHQEHIS